MLYELCMLLLVILRPLGQVAEAGVASMQLGVSMELMLCGLLTFMLGFFLMPWVLDLACVFLFVGFVTNLSGIGRAILCWPAVCEVLSHKEASTCLGGFGAKSNSPVHHQGGISHVNWTASVNLLSCRMSWKLKESSIDRSGMTAPLLPLGLFGKGQTREELKGEAAACHEDGSSLSSSGCSSWFHGFCKPDPVRVCYGGNYSSASSYHQSLELLSATLPQKASLAPRLFARASVVIGEATYGLAQCRGDIESAGCRTCIHDGLQGAEGFCGLRKEVFLASELCTLQLSGRAISWPSGMGISASQPDAATVQSSTFETGMDALVVGVSSLAANTSQLFATAAEEVEADGRHYTAYGLAQCTPELTPTDCATCLEDLSFAHLSRGSGGWFATSWCSYSVHLYKFFASQPLRQIPSVTSNTPSGDTKKRTRRRTIVGVTVGVSVAALLILISVIVLVLVRRRRRRSSHKITKTSIDEPKTERRKSDEEAAEHATCEAPTVEHSAWEALPSAIACFGQIIARAQAKRILLFLDYDGTLARIVKDPLEAFITPEMRQTVGAAAEMFSTSIVTGRDVPKAIDFVKLDNLNYAGSHGLDIKICGEENHYQPFPYLEPLVSKATACLEQALQGIDGIFVENNKFCVSVHFRNVDEKDWDLVETTVRTVLRDFPDLRLDTGKMVWEFRSKEVFTKGDAVEYLFKYLLELLQTDRSRVLAIHIGDDKTDEDAFKMLREKDYGFGILVTKEPKPTQALYSLEDPSEVMVFLQKLVAWREEEDGIVELH